MMITLDERAATWFQQEFDGIECVSIRMYPQYAGFGQQHKGYSLAFSAETPENAAFSKEINGITLFVEGNDIWFFEDTETLLTVDEQLNELRIDFKEDSNLVH